jgi:opacity protein-like surface antigen
LPYPERASLLARTAQLCLFTLIALIAGAASAWSQAPTDSPYYARTNTYSIFGAYSDDSSHIVLGVAENRKLLEFGVGYGRKLFANRMVNWQYNGEILPVALESDPRNHLVQNQTTPTSATYSYDAWPVVSCATMTTPYKWTENGVTYSGTFTSSCHGRQWTIGEAISPAGFQWNFLPQRKMQPFFIGHGGYMYSTQPIPISTAGSFNFTFDFGAGIEVFRTKTRSVRAEYRIHHISNAYTSSANPGIDNGLFQLTYSFGR